MATTIANLQRKIKIDTSIFTAFVKSFETSIEELRGNNFDVAFVSDRRMRELNSLFRGKDSTTDVLSFPNEPEQFELTADHRSLTTAFLGDIVISAEKAARQAKENGSTLENEIEQLILHGLLHLCGYDHETDNGEMNARELELREKFGI